MRAWQFTSTRNPLWRAFGSALILAIAAGTLLYVVRGPRPLPPSTDRSLTGSGAVGRFGTVTEPLGNGLFVLNYETINGQEEDLQLHKVTGRLQEPRATWRMECPTARKLGGVWTLSGPMDLTATAPDGRTPMGHGTISSGGPALAWDKGVWHGLAPLVWYDLQGSGQGRWDLPAGWYRGLDEKFVVDRGPVHWTAAQPGTVQTMEAERMWALLGFTQSHLEEVTAHLSGGQVLAKVVDVDPTWIRWGEPVSFTRDDGWRGSASGGQAPRPPEGGRIEQVEFRDFQANRPIADGSESVRADGARWTPAGLRLEGNVRLERPLEGDKLLLQAPRVLERDGPGEDLPADLPIGETWAESQAVLTWGAQSLSSPRIEGRRSSRQWHILAPSQGRGQSGTFTAGEGRGDPTRWEFSGPIQARFFDGTSTSADFLVWENERYTLTGRPVTVTRPRERLTGPRVIRQGENLDFPDGIAGALAALDGDLTVRADKGRAQRTLVILDGRVDCQGQGWSLQADRISVTLGAGNMVKQVDANGGVWLRGRLGEGRGDSLVLVPDQRTARWIGRVKAVTEAAP